MSDELRAALTELVACKDLMAQIGATNTEVEDEFYRRDGPAWKRARAALAATPATAEEVRPVLDHVECQNCGNWFFCEACGGLEPELHWRAALQASESPPEPSRGRDDAIAQAVKTCIEFGFYGVEPPPSGHWLNEMWDFGRALATQEQASESEEDEALRDRLSDILTRTANALRGDPPPRTRWSWHDLPDRAAAAIASIDLMQRVANNLATQERADPESDFERGRQQGMKQERALWEMAALSQQADRGTRHDG